MGKGLDMQIAEHFVGFPAAHQANDIGVNARAQEGHGTAGTEAASGNAVRVDVERGRGGPGGNAQGVGDGMASNGDPRFGLVHHVEWCGGRGIEMSQMQDAAKEGEHGAGEGVAGARMTNALSSDAIFLVSECQVDIRSGRKVGNGRRRAGHSPLTGVEDNVSQAER